jgi:hypothetical protein
MARLPEQDALERNAMTALRDGDPFAEPRAEDRLRLLSHRRRGLSNGHHPDAPGGR